MFQNDLTASESSNTAANASNEFEEALFSKINSYLSSTETLKKYSKFLIENYSEQTDTGAGGAISLNAFENIFSLNTELIDKLMLVLIDKLSKSYEVNEMFQDELKDLAQFEKEELIRVQKRLKMKSELFLLQKKHGPTLNVLYDDYQGATEEVKTDVRSFKSKYSQELEAELDIKFKEVFKLLADKREKKMYKYDDPVEFENDQKYIEMFERVKNKIMEEIRAMQNGTFKAAEADQMENKLPEGVAAEQEFRLENTLRSSMQRKFLGITDMYGDLMPKFYDDDVPNELQALEIPKKVFKGHKIPLEDEKKMINRRAKRFYDLINYSKTESTLIPKELVETIKQKFIESFGRYNDVIYPDGFRHLESFEMYQSVYPLRAMSEYIGECMCFLFKFLLFFVINKKYFIEKNSKLIDCKYKKYNILVFYLLFDLFYNRQRSL